MAVQTFHYGRCNQAELLLDFLAKRFPYKNRDGWQAVVKLGQIQVNNNRIEVGCILKPNDCIQYSRDANEEPAVSSHFTIIYQDAWILVVEKNGCLPTSPGGVYYCNTLLEKLKAKLGVNLYIVHRLDKETSGLVVLAKTKFAAQHLAAQFAASKPVKTYQALLQGKMPLKEMWVDAALKKAGSRGLVHIRQLIDPEGKPAKTHFILRHVAGNLSLVDIKTWHGRTHQIRCHAASLGLPVLGDKLYGQSDQQFLKFLQSLEQPLFEGFGEINRHLLHANYLSFEHPEDSRRVGFESKAYPFFAVFPKIQQWFSKHQIERLAS